MCQMERNPAFPRTRARAHPPAQAHLLAMVHAGHLGLALEVPHVREGVHALLADVHVVGRDQLGAGHKKANATHL